MQSDPSFNLPAFDEELWNELRTLVAWNERFTLVLLYSSHPLSLTALRRRVDDTLRFQTQSLTHLDPDSPDSAVAEIIAALQPAPANRPRRNPVWIDLHRSPGDAAWNRSREDVLARLNEQRSRLEHDVPTLLILTLPTHFISRVAVIAPDLWSVRTLSREVRPPDPLSLLEPSGTGTPYPAHRDHGDGFAPPALKRSSPSADTGQEATLIAEWNRWVRGPQSAPPPPSIAADLVDLLLGRGQAGHAESFAVSWIEALRPHAAKFDASPPWRAALASALALLGRTRFEQEHWAGSADAYRESLQLRRQLVAESVASPHALRDLSVALDHVGRVEEALAHWEPAANAFRESLELRRQIVRESGPSPESLRDLSVALNNVGRIEEVLARWESAANAFRESLRLRRQMVAQWGPSPIALRDLAVSLNNIGRVEETLTRWEAAADAYRESLELRTQLLDASGPPPQARVDLADVHLSIARLARKQSRTADELAHLQAGVEGLQKAVSIGSPASALEGPLRAAKDRLAELAATPRT